MQLIYECTYRAELDPQRLIVGNGPAGMRLVASVSGGKCRGERLNGSLRGAGADWLVIGNDGFGRLDVRGQLVTDDGAVIYLQYGGLLEMNAAVNAAGTSGETRFEDQYFRTTPRMETGDPRYAWVNTTLFAARGRIVPGGVEYEVFRLG